MRRRRVAIALLLAVTAFYGRVLFTGVAPQWDGIAYYYPYQKHFADSIHAGKLPFWTSTVLSGFPFLADLQVGAWYPLNWPFFVAGITPETMFWELWLHACLAAIGAFLLVEALTGSIGAGVLAGIIYSLSGYFTAHGEHVGLFQTAAWLPLVLYLFRRGLEGGGRRSIAGLALAGGALSLAGHFQTALYVFTALALWGAALVAGKPRLWRRAALLLVVTAAGSLAIAAVQVLPTAELLGYSYRSRISAKQWTHGIVEWGSAATFAYPNALGAFDERYTGPADISQHYFYAGVLLLPLAAFGLLDRGARRLALWLIVPAVLYAIGPPGQLFRLVAELPGFSSVRAPSHAMFVATLGLALLAAAGAQRLRGRWVLPLVCVVFLADLWYWNMARTRLLYAKGTYKEVNEPGVRWFREMVKLPLPPMQRVAAPGRWTYFYPADAPFGEGVEITYGSNALVLTRYYEYLEALNANPGPLMSALGVGVYFDSKEWVARKHEPALPRFYFPPRLLFTRDPLGALKTVDSVTTGVLEGEAREAENPPGEARVLEYAEDRYRVGVSTPRGGTMRIAIPWFPGWRATIDGAPAALRVMDHALMAVDVPAGEHELRLWFRSNYFALGAVISAVAVVAGLALLGRRPA